MKLLIPQLLSLSTLLTLGVSSFSSYPSASMMVTNGVYQLTVPTSTMSTSAPAVNTSAPSMFQLSTDSEFNFILLEAMALSHGDGAGVGEVRA